MLKLMCQAAIVTAVVQICSVLAATQTYQLAGGNTATVTTASRQCCNRQTTDVTTSVSAVLHAKSSQRTNFGSSRFDKRMDLLDRQPRDQKGHILASVFGGPAEIWNLAPQADNVNKRLNNMNSILVGWYECEKWIQKELEKGNHLPVRATMKLTYSAMGSCRPTYWSIEAKNNDPRDPGCKADNIVNGFGGPFTCKKHT